MNGRSQWVVGQAWKPTEQDGRASCNLDAAPRATHANMAC